MNGFTDISAIVVCQILGLTPPPDASASKFFNYNTYLFSVTGQFTPGLLRDSVLAVVNLEMVTDFGFAPVVPLLATLECEGDETGVLQCPRIGAISGQVCEPAGVICFPRTLHHPQFCIS